MKRSSEFVVGWHLGGNGTSIELQALSLNAVAVAFIAPAAQVSAVRLPISAVTGGIAAGDLRCRIVPESSANNYLPNLSSVIAVGYSLNDANSANMFVNIGNFTTHSLTQGTRYWLVFDNWGDEGSASVLPTDNPLQSGHNFAHAVAGFSAGSWTYNGTARRLGEQIEFSNGDIVHAGLITNNISDGLTVYGSRMSGVRVSLGSVGLRVAGISWWGARGGSGCTIATRVLDLSGNVLATSHSVFGAQQSGNALRPWYFSEPVELEPNSSYRIVLANPNSDGSSTNNFRLTGRIRAYSSASVSLLHSGIFTSLQSSDFDGTSWSDDTNNNLPRAFLLVLDADQPFIVSSGGGGGGSSDGIVPALNRGVW